LWWTTTIERRTSVDAVTFRTLRGGSEMGFVRDVASFRGTQLGWLLRPSI